MKTGFKGTFVISWSQTEIDGLSAAPMDALDVGAAWSWHGDAVRVDGPTELLRLDMANGEADLRRRAAKSVRRLVGAAVQHRTDVAAIEVDEPLLDSSFVVTNGVRSYTGTLIEVGPTQRPLLMFVDELPPRNTDLWVVHHSMGCIAAPDQPAEGGVICFTPGTRIATPEGPRLVENLREGEWVQTRDNGAQQVLWIGSRRMSGARLFVMPKLRPVRIKAGALGIDRPEGELLVSPEHRMLVRGSTAQSLFNTSEVLVAARDLINGSTIIRDLAVREVTYVHLLLSDHQVIWANGVETESFHPANAALSALDDSDRLRLLRLLPGLDSDPLSYGGFARRNLSAPEAAILAHEAA
ncbi:Hint domain-containing protein [Parasedimentitalea maritima]|uniref:Hint domain-containing protein n=1 Tax=Parasedimentitalea maritima TaxID=2578117 RepID=A0ABY2URP7_9RHOB|nr:Hint domain-containing protein [Zongyanglinia marina]TLP58495.1 Hint domain-containing protein [Zongyanglinia marina]